MRMFLRGIATLIALLICLILVTIYVLEYHKGNFPCPLCYIQQSALIGLIASELLNARFGTSTKHYALANVCSILGGATAFYQLALNQFAFTGKNGNVLFSLTFYSWSLIVFSTIFFVISLLLFMTNDEKPSENPLPMSKLTKFVFGFGTIVALTSGIVAVLYP